MKIFTQHSRLKSNDLSRAKVSSSARYNLSSKRMNRPEVSESFLNLIEMKTSVDSLNRSFGGCYSHELSRANRVLDSWETNHKTMKNFEGMTNAYLHYLESIALVVKGKDPNLAGCLSRGLSGIKEASGLAGKMLVELNQRNFQSREPQMKFRDNQTQTYKIKEVEEPFPDTSNEIAHLKGLINRVDELKYEKITEKLYNLHEDLCKMRTDIPNASDTPEPPETTIGSLGQKLGLTVKLIKGEIAKNLSRHSIERLKAEKAVQADSQKQDFFKIIINEKDMEIEKLKKFKSLLENEILNNQESLNILRSNSYEAERKFNESQIENVQLKGRIVSIEDTCKTLKQKFRNLTEKLFKKKQKILSLKKDLAELATERNLSNSLLKQSKSELFNVTIMNKMTEEKLIQIETAWTQVVHKSFEYQNVSSIEICKKYNLYPDSTQSNDAESSSKGSPRARRQSSLGLSPQCSPKILMRNFSKVTEEYSSYFVSSQNQIIKTSSPETNPSIQPTFSILKPLIQPQFKLEIKPSESLDSPINPLAQSIESRINKEFSPIHKDLTRSKQNQVSHTRVISQSKLNLESLCFPESGNQWGNDSLISAEKANEIAKPLTLKDTRASKNLRVNIMKESGNGASPLLDRSPNAKSSKILAALMIEQDIIHSKYDKEKNVEENSKGIQCEIILERHKSIERSGTMRNRHMFTSEIFDEETIQNLKKHWKNEDELEGLPQYLKLDLLKCLDGHDSKKCDKECVHLKRVAKLKIKCTGVPYPIKRTKINPKFSN